jgi:hypothetical protein
MSRGKEKGLPSPPLKNSVEGAEDVSAELALTTESAATGSSIESADEHSRATSESNSVIDYSNQSRRIVYENTKTQESAILETVTENSETVSTDMNSEVGAALIGVDTIPQIQDVTEPKEAPKENDVIEIVNFSDDDVSTIPAQWPQIKQVSEKDIAPAQTKSEAGGKSSDVSFNFSDLSDISEPPAEKKLTPVLSTTFSDEEDNDEEIVNAPVHLLEKSSVVPSAPEEDEKSVDISELLDHFSNQIKKAPSIESIV